MLDKPWHSYIPMEGDTVTAQIVDTAVVLPGDDLAPADECIDNLTDDRCRDAAEMDAANAMMALYSLINNNNISFCQLNN